MQQSPTTLRDVAPGRIMVVDDDRNARQLLRRVLEQDGHQAVECASGQDALTEIDRQAPDLVLLDVVMEGIDGHELCRRLKANPATASIPVLLISGFTRRQDRLRGIESGANDFIGKPMDLREVGLRVRNNLIAKRLYDQVSEAYTKLKELEELRDSLTHMIIHDIRSPLTGLMGYLELLDGSLKEEASDSGSRELLDTARRLAEIIAHMVHSVLDVTLLENKTMPLSLGRRDLVSIVQDALVMLGPKLHSHRVEFQPPKNGVKAWCDQDVTKRIFANLLINAASFTPTTLPIEISLVSRKDEIECRVIDHGPGIPDDHHDLIFRKFGFLESEKRRKQQNRSAGLGLAFCKMAVEAQGGRIGVDSEEGRGSEFWFTLPGSAPASNKKT